MGGCVLLIAILIASCFPPPRKALSRPESNEDTSPGAMLERRFWDYIETFNRGDIPETMAFVKARLGEEKRLERNIRSKMEAGTTYKILEFRAVVISARSGSIGFICEEVTSRGVRKEVELTIRWWLRHGKWMIHDHP